MLGKVPKAIGVVERKLTRSEAHGGPKHNGNQLALIVDPVGVPAAYDMDDLLLKRHPLCPAATRFSGYVGNTAVMAGLQDICTALGANNATCRAARRAVADGVSQLGGIKAVWSDPKLVIGAGEFGMVDRAQRWVLTVTVDYAEEEDSDDSGDDEREGIKRIRAV